MDESVRACPTRQKLEQHGNQVDRIAIFLGDARCASIGGEFAQHREYFLFDLFAGVQSRLVVDGRVRGLAGLKCHQHALHVFATGRIGFRPTAFVQQLSKCPKEVGIKTIRMRLLQVGGLDLRKFSMIRSVYQWAGDGFATCGLACVASPSLGRNIRRCAVRRGADRKYLLVRQNALFREIVVERVVKRGYPKKDDAFKTSKQDQPMLKYQIQCGRSMAQRFDHRSGSKRHGLRSDSRRSREHAKTVSKCIQRLAHAQFDPGCNVGEHKRFIQMCGLG